MGFYSCDVLRIAFRYLDIDGATSSVNATASSSATTSSVTSTLLAKKDSLTVATLDANVSASSKSTLSTNFSNFSDLPNHQPGLPLSQALQCKTQRTILSDSP